jgi:hypothetical protein
LHGDPALDKAAISPTERKREDRIAARDHARRAGGDHVIDALAPDDESGDDLSNGSKRICKAIQIDAFDISVALFNLAMA